FQRVLGRTLSVREAGRRPGDTPGVYTRTERARRLLDWKAELTIEEGIRHALQWADIRDRILTEPAAPAGPMPR
ncbi:MAG TPA: hypothetical protein VF174_10775, partial [Micromonosporaceae bacterium]